MTMGDSRGWGYIRHNPNMKSVTQLIQHLVNAAAGAGNYLLNVGPKADGTIPRECVTRLERMGDWMKVNWNEEDTKNPRFSPKFVGGHLKFIADLQKKYYTQDLETVNERLKKYVSYGKIIKPQS